MIILHISSDDIRGAGLCAYRIHKTLQWMGQDSRMLVLEKHQEDESVVQCFKLRSFLFRKFHGLLRILGVYLFEYDKLIRMSAKYNSFYSRPVSPFDLSNHKLVKQADVIHLHWVDNYFDVPKFLDKVKKPIVWTLHDEGLFCGTAHYQNEIVKNDFLEIKYSIIKKEMLQKAYKLGVVFLSEYFMSSFGSTSMLQGIPKRVINNSVDCNRFKPFDREESRKMVGIDSKFTVFLFIAAKIDDKRKGLLKLIQAIDHFQSDSYKVLAIGDDSTFSGHPNVITKGIVRDSLQMSRLISASDYFVMPSNKEAFAQTPIEAMACGIPAVVFPVSGTKELITCNNGVLCTGFATKDLLKGINTALMMKFDKDTIRNDVQKRFSPVVICQQYVDFYRDLMNNLNN